MKENTHTTELTRVPKETPKPSLLSRLKLGSKPGDEAKILRAFLTFLREFGSEQLKQIPIAGPALSGVAAALEGLSQEEDDEKLEERIKELLKVGEETQDSVLALTGLTILMYQQQQLLLQSFQKFGLPSEPQQIEEITAATALIACRNRLLKDNKFKYVDYRGIAGMANAEHATSLPLDEVYIMPRLLAENARRDIHDQERSLLKSLEDPDLSPEEMERCQKKYLRLISHRWRGSEQGSSLAEVMASSRHAVVIGSPGVGKTTLIRVLARGCALGGERMQERLGWSEDLIPIVLTLAAFADARASNKSLSLQCYLDAKMTELGGEPLRRAIQAEMKEGRVLVLLDGVDEIPESNARAALVQAVDTFLNAHKECRCIVTSRIYGYVRLAGDLPHYQLLNFTPEQVKILFISGKKLLNSGNILPIQIMSRRKRKRRQWL